MDRSQARL